MQYLWGELNIQELEIWFRESLCNIYRSSWSPLIFVKRTTTKLWNSICIFTLEPFKIQFFNKIMLPNNRITSEYFWRSIINLLSSARFPDSLPLEHVLDIRQETFKFSPPSTDLGEHSTSSRGGMHWVISEWNWQSHWTNAKVFNLLLF